MGKTAPNAAGNAFYCARCEASTLNPIFASREGVSDVTGIDKTKLYRIECGVVLPWPEEALLFADLYNKPELLNFYCCECCPIGKRTVEPVQIADLDRLTILLTSSAKKIAKATGDLMEVAEDGIISENEKATVTQIKDTLQATKKNIDALLMWYEKTIK